MAPRVSGSGQYAHRTKGRTARLCALIFALVTCTLATTGGFGGGSGHASNVVVESWHDRGHLPTSSGRDADALSRVSGDGPGGGDVSGRRPLVAVYFTGQARTLNRTLCSIRRRIFEPLIFAGYTPVVFVAGERDDEASDYERYLGAIRDVELGDVSIVPRPHVSRDPSEVPVPYDRLPPPSPILSSRRPSRARVCASSGARVDGSTAAATAPSAALKTQFTARRYCRSCTTARWWTGFGDDGRRGVPQRSSGSSSLGRIMCTSTICPTCAGSIPRRSAGRFGYPPGARATTQTRARAS